MSKPVYRTLRELLDHVPLVDENETTRALIQRLRHVRRDRYMTDHELAAICYWKSPRAIRRVAENAANSVISLTHAAFTSRSEKRRIEYLTQLHGVGIPVASSILTLIWPERYGVIDIRVWRLLYVLREVSSNPSGSAFDCDEWILYLRTLRSHAKRLNTSVRAVERTLFEYHKTIQTKPLYGTHESSTCVSLSQNQEPAR